MKLLIVCGGFIVFDIITGLTKAFKNGNINSSILRNGFFHKLGEVFALCGCLFFGYATKFIEFNVNLPLLPVVSLYIAIMETISIIENICEISPAMYKVFKPYLAKLKGDENK